MLNHNIREYSQWFPGRDNIVADALSRDFHLSDDQLTKLIVSTFSSQTPTNFNIVPLPREIDSWICALLQQMPESPQPLEGHTPSKLSHGIDGDNSLLPLIFPMTHISNP